MRLAVELLCECACVPACECTGARGRGRACLDNLHVRARACGDVGEGRALTSVFLFALMVLPEVHQSRLIHEEVCFACVYYFSWNDWMEYWEGNAGHWCGVRAAW